MDRKPGTTCMFIDGKHSTYVEVVKLLQSSKDRNGNALYIVKHVRGKWAGMEFRANGKNLIGE